MFFLNRRKLFVPILTSVACVAFSASVWALSLSDLSNQDANAGLKAA